LPDADLGVLGDVADKDVLELGCGAAHACVALARRGARPVGVDIAERQLAHARRTTRQAGLKVPLVQASATELPFQEASFDVVFSDHGAVALAAPERTVAEAARVLRGRGLLAFLVPGPLTFLCWNRQLGRIGNALQRSYFEMASDPLGEAATQQRTYGDWVRLFRACGLSVEDLVEVRAPEGGATTFPGFAPPDWARRYPAEVIWKVRRGPVRRRKQSA
jgi:SAM-dependent methyltransferase